MKPITGAVYFLYKGGELVYIWQSNNVFSRIGQHISEGVKDFDDFRIYETNDFVRLEGFLISALHPKYNKTNGNEWDMHYAEKDMFWIQLPPGKILEIIKNHENGIPKKYLKDVAKSHPRLCYQRVSSLLLQHMDEMPIYRVNHEWFIEPVWYKENEKRLVNMVDRWDYEEIRERKSGDAEQDH